MLTRLNGVFVDLAMVEFARERDLEETGGGGETHYRGEPGFVAFDAADGEPLLVSSKFVRAVRPDGENRSELEMVSGAKLLVEGTPEWCADLVNRARRHV